MSTIILGQCWPIHLPHTAKAVLISLADQANDSGVCWPSVGTLTKRTCLSERACQRALAYLEEHGHITKDERPGRSTVYKLHPILADTPVRLAPHPRQAGTPGGATQSPGGATQSPRTVTEPSVEPSLPLLAPSPKSRGNGAAGKPVTFIPLNDGSAYGITDLQIEEFAKLYPAVDVPQTLNEIRGWSLTHPQRRKTRRGILAHVNGWLSKEQNRGPQTR